MLLACPVALSSVCPGCATTCMRRVLPAPQGFDKYGVGAFDAIPTPHLQQELGLKAGGSVEGGHSVARHAPRLRRLLGCGACRWLHLPAGCQHGSSTPQSSGTRCTLSACTPIPACPAPPGRLQAW